MRLYLDVDGVLLGKRDGQVALASHCKDFIEFATSKFDVFWLTTHCNGNTVQVLDYLRPYADEELIGQMSAIKPACFDVLKTSALEGDFYWIEDSPLASELKHLQSIGMFDRWIEVNTRIREDDLLFARSDLTRILDVRAVSGCRLRRPSPL